MLTDTQDDVKNPCDLIIKTSYELNFTKMERKHFFFLILRISNKRFDTQLNKLLRMSEFLKLRVETQSWVADS